MSDSNEPINRTDRAIPIDPDSLIFLIPLAIVIAIGGIWGWLWLWIPAALLALCVMAFFRDPARAVPEEPGLVISPADGKVVLIEENADPARGPVPGKRIVIFLSVLNCHINRAPMAGKVTSIRYQKGLFLNALDAVSSDKNECNWVHMETAAGAVTVRQIAGLIARRIVCRVREGQEVKRGERIGLIRFGSRTELYLPPDAEIKIGLGQKVTGAKTVMAKLPG